MLLRYYVTSVFASARRVCFSVSSELQHGMSATLNPVPLGIQWPEEPWVCSDDEAAQLLARLNTEIGGDVRLFFDAFEKLPRSARKLLWHLPADRAVALLFQGEDHKPGLTFRLAEDDRKFVETGPGTDQDAWRRFFERIRFVAAGATRIRILSVQRLASIVLVLQSIQSGSYNEVSEDPDGDDVVPF